MKSLSDRLICGIDEAGRGALAGPLVAAAVLVNKHTLTKLSRIKLRDKLMKKIHKEYKKYKWNLNAGYGTKYHISIIKEIGVTKYHRSIFVTTALRNSSTSTS